MKLMPAIPTYRVGHLFCGIGAGAKGFNDANPRVHGVTARFICAGGVDSDAGAIRNFDRITGSKGTVMDLFDREQYTAFHGHEPPPTWREATPADIRRAHGDAPLDVMFLSAPCKGFSGLLSAKASGTAKYQALNDLTVRGVWLTLEAYKDNPIRIILFENVPRIMTRGRALLNKIKALFRAFGYVFAETQHNCGEIGELAQSRNRFLMVARHAASVPPFLYQPVKSKLRGVGEVIGLLPMPGDPLAGPMHRVPQLQWKTWVRLAFVPAGKDWRALNDLAVEDGHLRDYGIVPEKAMRDNQLGVCEWDAAAPTLTGQRSPAQGRFSVADPRVEGVHNDALGVRPWDGTARVVAGASRPANGAHSVADPRPTQSNQSYGQYGVNDWQSSTGTVTGQAAPGGGPNSIADPRLNRVAHSNVYRVARYDAPAVAITSSRDTAVADPRPTHGPQAHQNKHRVVRYGEACPVVTGSDRVGSGALSVADPRVHPPVCDDNRAGPLPAAADRLVARIIAPDGTWHRPFTTLEMAALQSIFDPGEVFDLEGGSDQVKREWIGNAVPSRAARGMAETIGETLLLADLGETFVLSSRAIWTKPLALALSVDPRQTVEGEVLQ